MKAILDAIHENSEEDLHNSNAFVICVSFQQDIKYSQEPVRSHSMSAIRSAEEKDTIHR